MGIADELITRGWTQGRSEGGDGSVCLRGAAAYATKGSVLYAYDLAPSVEAALLKATGRAWWEGVAPWNDDPERTFDEVLRVAKHADEILDA